MKNSTRKSSPDEEIRPGDQIGPDENGPAIEPDTPEVVAGARVTDRPASNSNGQTDGAVPIAINGDGDDFDPLDLETIRKSQDFASLIVTQKVITKIPVRKPSDEWWVRVHPDPAFRIEAPMLELKDTPGAKRGELYFLSWPIYDVMKGRRQVSLRLLVTAIAANDAVPFLWPFRLPGLDGKTDDWMDTALQALKAAEVAWIQVKPDMNRGCYRWDIAPNQAPRLQFPEGLTFQEILRIAFKDRVIKSWNHPVRRQLYGEP
jgi:hypothetical protein